MIHYVRRSANQHFGSTIKMNIPPNPKPHTNSEMDSKTIIKNNKNNKHNNLTYDQKNELIEQFVEIQVDLMDTETLVEFVTDMLIDEYSDFSQEELKERIDCFDDDGLYDELVENVTT